MTVCLLIAALLFALALPVGALFTEEEKTAANRAALGFAAEKGMISAIPDGSPAAREPISRAEAAKLVCVAAEGKEKAEALTKTETGFSDVPAAHEMAKYIAYCAEKKLIDGADGKFDPDGAMTAVRLARALLIAFDYAKADELSGEDWIVKTQKALRPKQLNWYIDTTADRAISRASACQLAYNVQFNAELDRIEPDAYKEVTIPFTDSSKYKLLGRALQTEDGVICDWSADGVEFTIDCKGVITLTASASYVPISYHAYRVIVDGVPSDWLQVKAPGVRTCPLVVNLPAGVHTIRVIKDSAVNRSTDKILSIKMTCKPETMKPTPQKAKFIEIIGDSTSQGAGDYLPTDDMRTTAMATSAYLAYGYIAAEALDMDYQMLVKGSLGVVKKTGSPVEQNYVTLYEYQNHYRVPDDPVQYSFPRKADVVVIKVSGNDGKVPSEEWTAAELAFHEMIRKHHGADVPIILMYYAGSGPTGRRKDVETIVANDPNIYCVMITANAGGTGGHPSRAAQEKFASQLIEQIKALNLK